MKRSFVFLLILSLILFATPGFGQTISNENEARTLYELKLFNGISTTEFVPDLANMSNREQAMIIIAVALQWQLDMSAKSPFNDVSDWAQPYVAKAYQMGVTSGISATEFGGKRNVTQRELAAWMLRALGYDGNETWNNTVQLSAHIGSTLDPATMNTQINRDKLVGMLYNFLKEGKVISENKTLIQKYLDTHPNFAGIAQKAGMTAASGDGSSSVDPFKIGLIVDPAGIVDNAINKMAWEGVQKFANQYQLASTDYGYKKAASYEEMFDPFDQSNISDKDLIIANGYAFNEAVAIYADLNPDKNFVIIDGSVESPNVTSVGFKEEEGSFLAGVAAGLKAIEAGATKVGFIGGMDFDLIHKFEAGYEAGVKAAAPSVQVAVDYLDTFTDESIAKSAAASMYDDGVLVIFHASGPAGMGIIDEAKTRASGGDTAFVIGVDYDQYDDGIYDTGKSVVLTSMIKRFDSAVFNVCEMAFKEKLTSGPLNFGIREEGIGLPAINPNISQEMNQKISSFEGQIISNEIIVPVVPSRLK